MFQNHSSMMVAFLVAVISLISNHSSLADTATDETPPAPNAT